MCVCHLGVSADSLLSEHQGSPLKARCNGRRFWSHHGQQHNPNCLLVPQNLRHCSHSCFSMLMPIPSCWHALGKWLLSEIKGSNQKRTSHPTLSHNNLRSSNTSIRLPRTGQGSSPTQAFPENFHRGEWGGGLWKRGEDGSVWNPERVLDWEIKGPIRLSPSICPICKSPSPSWCHLILQYL